MTTSDEFGENLHEAPLRRLVVIAGHVQRQRWNRVVEQEHGISPAGVNALVALARSEPWTTHRNLAERCWIRPASLTPVIDALVRGGLVQRRRDHQDRRVVWISLTRDGQRRAEEILERLRERFEEIPEEFDQEAELIIRGYLINLITATEQEAR